MAGSSSNSTSDVVGVDPPAAEMLRNAVVSCREEAVGVYDQIFSGGMEPQIDPMAAASRTRR